MKILDEFYCGNVSSSDRTPAYREEIKDVLRLLERNRHLLLADLTEEQKDRFEKFCETFNEHRSIDDRYAFLAGFRLGVRMMAECFTDEG